MASWVFCLIEVPELIKGIMEKAFQSNVASLGKRCQVTIGLSHQLVSTRFSTDVFGLSSPTRRTRGEDMGTDRYLRGNFRKQEGGSSMNGKEAEEEREPV